MEKIIEKLDAIEAANLAKVEEVTATVDAKLAETVGPESTGTKYNKSSVRVKLKTSPLSENKSQVEKWMSDQPNPTDSFKKYTFEEMKSALEKWLSPEDEAEEGDIISEANDSFEDEVPSTDRLPWEEEAAAPKANYSLNTSKVKQSKGDQFNALYGASSMAISFSMMRMYSPNAKVRSWGEFSPPYFMPTLALLIS